MHSSLVLASLALGALAACDSGPPTFPPLDIDAGIECSEDLACEDEGDVCLDGRCYQPCSATSGCGPMEVCGAGGVCMRGIPPDAGPVDAGPGDAGPPDAPPDAPLPDPCEAVRCEGATPICRAGVCIQCNDSTMCGGGSPICDVGRGACTSYAPALCAPCNTNFDCQATGGMSFGDCVGRGGPGGSPDEPQERVCLATCTDSSMCAAGYRCDGSHCIPAGGGSCTQQLAGLAMRACMSEADCAPVGATAATGLVTGSCTEMMCRIPCGAATDCPTDLPTCDSTFFCAP